MTSRWAAACCAMAVSGLAWPGQPVGAADPDDFEVFTYDWGSNQTLDAGRDVPGRLYVPTDYDPQGAESYPLVIFLHGIGEKGTNNTSQVNGNINALLAKAQPGERDFFLYAPQSNNGLWAEIANVVNMAGRAANEYRIDPARMYVTGLSAGGLGTLKAANSYYKLFAGFVPLSPGDDVSSSEAPPLVGEPMWFYHSRNDSVVPVSKSRNSVNHLLAAAGDATLTFPLSSGWPYYTDGSTYFANIEDNLRYSEYLTGGHSNGCWARAYSEEPLYDWLLAKLTPIAAPAADRSILVDLGRLAGGADVDDQGRKWNAADQYGAYRTLEVAVPFAVDDQGTRTTVRLSVSKVFDSDADAVPAGLTVLDDEAVNDYWLVGDWNLSNLTPAELTFDGLTPGGVYDLTLFASISGDDGGRGHKGEYSVGGQVIVFDSTDNLTSFIEFDDVQADADGQLVLSVVPTDGSRFAVINAIELTAAAEPASTGVLAVADFGTASGSAYFPLIGAFDDQPTVNPPTDQTYTINDGGAGLSFYGNRQSYIDFGPDYADIRITGTWTLWRQFGRTPQDPISYWWSSDKDNLFDGDDVAENAPGFGWVNQVASPNPTSDHVWHREYSGAPIAPAHRYLIISTGAQNTNGVMEIALTGTTDAAPPPTQVISPLAAGAADGIGYFPLERAFDDQPAAYPPTDETYTSSDGGAGVAFYAGRQAYIDFGPDYADVRITGTWTLWRQFGRTPQDPITYWWSSDKALTFDAGDVAENTAGFGWVNFIPPANPTSDHVWHQEYDGAAITPPHRYLIISAPSQNTNGAMEYAITGTIEP